MEIHNWTDWEHLKSSAYKWLNFTQKKRRKTIENTRASPSSKSSLLRPCCAVAAAKRVLHSCVKQ